MPHAHRSSRLLSHLCPSSLLAAAPPGGGDGLVVVPVAMLDDIVTLLLLLLVVDLLGALRVVVGGVGGARLGGAGRALHLLAV